MSKTKCIGLPTAFLCAVLTGTLVHADTIVIYGASGKIGSKIVTEALDRGHDVIGVSRNPDGLSIDHPNFSAVSGDASDLDSMLETIQGVDAVILSVRSYGPNNYPEETLNNRSSKTFIAASRHIGEDAPRVIHLGGGSTLYTNGVLGLDTQTREEGTLLHGLVWGHWLALQNYRTTTSVKWTVISPSGTYDADGPRTGIYRTGADEVLVDENGETNGISHRDMAAAVIDEIETPQSIGKRMTVGY
jgi:putative NADH-flavin reductase